MRNVLGQKKGKFWRQLPAQYNVISVTAIVTGHNDFIAR